LRASKLAVRSVGQGKEVAEIIDSSFHTGEVVPRPERFNSKFGKLTEPEIQEYLKESVSAQRIKAGPEGFTREQAMAEAARCLHCDCRPLNRANFVCYPINMEPISVVFSTMNVNLPGKQ
jgi:hypothetical protein